MWSLECPRNMAAGAQSVGDAAAPFRAALWSHVSRFLSCSVGQREFQPQEQGIQLQTFPRRAEGVEERGARPWCAEGCRCRRQERRLRCVLQVVGRGDRLSAPADKGCAVERRDQGPWELRGGGTPG